MNEVKVVEVLPNGLTKVELPEPDYSGWSALVKEIMELTKPEEPPVNQSGE